MNDAPYLSLVKPWRVEERGEIARTNIFTLRKRLCQSVDDPTRAGEFVYLDSNDWCNVVAVTQDDRVVMIEQFRYGTANITLELPGGVVDEGEAPAETCARELLEETGYAGAKVRLIGSVSANPAMQNNRCHFGLVRDAKLVGEQQPDENEQIGVRLVDRAALPQLVRDGVIDHSLIVAALYQFALLGG
jgi:8-oxo-dGTP pyrophosphatase MutT (NUDIX family)